MSSTSLAGSAATSSTSAAQSSAAAQSGGNNGPSSPLLFFVALGFGVVFTNLWIIVGVKYCFRYNQRNRARMNGEDPEGVDLGTLPRAHRRRREKKLMTMEEVDERFPLTKYKAWRSSRAEEGLPSAGGIVVGSAPSRASSIKHHNGVINEEGSGAEMEQASSTKAREDKDDDAFMHGAPEIVDSSAAPEKAPQFASPEITTSDNRPATALSSTTPATKVTTEDGDVDAEADDEEDQIQPTVPAEQLPDPGDACAICLDVIEDEDDVRGLNCGHAFHASCLDPWLTSRRACCPLCKADYYVPKPRTADEEAADEQRRRIRTDVPTAPPFAFMGAGRGGSLRPFGDRRRTSLVLPGRFMTIVHDPNSRYGFPVVVREPRPTRADIRAERERLRQASTTTGQSQSAETAEPSTWRRRVGSIRMPNLIPPLPAFHRTGYGYGANHGDERARARSEAGTAATEGNVTTTESEVTPARLEEGQP